MKSKRIANKFKQLKEKKECGFVAYLCGGHPNLPQYQQILKQLPKNGVDFIEIGLPFLDPAGDGPIIEKASRLAVTNGANIKNILDSVAEFRKSDSETPIIFMSYYNPILSFGTNIFFQEAEMAGADGILIVDLPIEEIDEISKFIKETNLDLINLITPNSNKERIIKIANLTTGFLYLVSLIGITGTKDANLEENKHKIDEVRNILTTEKIDLPIALGFGIKTPEQAKGFVKTGADAIIIGSAIVQNIEDNFNSNQEVLPNNTSDNEFTESINSKINYFGSFIGDFTKKIKLLDDESK